MPPPELDYPDEKIRWAGSTIRRALPRRARRRARGRRQNEDIFALEGNI